ncbi:hypothetical protein WJX72_002887 [[Myrmecia] bisecta]|uniref:Protein kinase domain-containing protein n=1 Tax=[Myrmecia] bisecta TaxID=41462 RepID=A0AAW1R550_9CHLO
MQPARSNSEPLENHVKYQKVQDLNKGSYGFVVLALDRTTGEYVAIKFMERGEKITKYVEREIINHSNLLHPHIVQFKEVFLTEQHLAIVMEYAPGGDMFQYVKSKRGLQEFEARWFFQQLIIGMDFMHKMGVVNRDIKLENTLLDGSRRPLLKICDFGYSKHAKDSLPKSKVGTPGYTAPEIISNMRHYDGKMVDLWSAGVMLYVMLFCEYPFERPADAQDTRRFQNILQRILQVDYHLPPNKPVSPECRDLLTRILVADPHKRITIPQIQQHPWYLQDLPPGLLTFNDSCLANQQQSAAVTQQNAEAIRQIVREAKRIHGQPVLETQVSDDCEYIDDIIDNESYYNTDTV